MSGTETGSIPTSGLEGSQAIELGTSGAGTSEKNIPSGAAGASGDDAGNAGGNAGAQDGGGSQGSSEGGRSEGTEGGRRQRWSKIDEIRELRSHRRALQSKVSELENILGDLRQERSRPRDRRGDDTAPEPRTREDFWTNPDARFSDLDARFNKRLEQMQEKFLNSLQDMRQEEKAQAQLDSERDQATKWIRTQEGFTREDEADLIDVIHENGLDALPPMRAARIAMSLWRDEMGIADKSNLRQRASSMVGKPPVGGRKVWSQAELDKVLDDCISHPEKLTPELEREIRDAQMEGRIR